MALLRRPQGKTGQDEVKESYVVRDVNRRIARESLELVYI